MSATLDWHGKEMSDLVEHALRLGIDKTASEGAIEAKGLVHIDTALLQGSIYPEPAKKNADGEIEGAYGPHDIVYAAAQEFLLGEKLPDGGTRTRKGGKPYMRPSMKTVEKSLPGNIAAAYRSLS
jgi:hypothetical protein